MAGLFERWIERTADDAVRSYIDSDRFKNQLAKHVKWALQGFEPGFHYRDRERFTETVAARIRSKARRPVYLFGLRIWRAPMLLADCLKEAENIVSDFLYSEKIKFGDPQYYWDDGIDLADEEMSYWEACP